MTMFFHTPASDWGKKRNKKKDKNVTSPAVRFKSDTLIHHSNVFQTGKPKCQNTGTGRMSAVLAT